MTWIVLLLIIGFSSLTFEGLTVMRLLSWFNNHPFLSLLMLNFLIQHDYYMLNTKENK